MAGLVMDMNNRDFTLYSGLPPPFNLLQCINDSRRKGRRVLAILNDNFELSACMAPPGIAITPAASYTSFDSIGWMQCTNAERYSVGYIYVLVGTTYLQRVLQTLKVR